LLKQGAELEERNLAKDPPPADELDELVGSRSHLDFLNAKNELYRKLRWKEKPPSRAEALKWMAKEPNLIRRPIVIRGNRMILGYDEKALKDLAK
jgi:arsenate reductase-like glutaredoxin family protein